MNLHFETKYGSPSEAALALPFSPRLPKDRLSLLKLRRNIHERCITDLQFRQDVMQMCALDLPFFVSIFGWMHETREGEESIGEFPVILDSDQIDILAWWQRYAGKIDLTDEKTRGIGFSYLVSYLVLWLWLFNTNKINIGILTETVEKLDQLNRPGTLMGKLDLMFRRLPYWVKNQGPYRGDARDGYGILYRTSSSHHRFNNRLNGNCITGFSANDDTARGDRLYILVVDEGTFLKVDEQKWLAATFGAVPSTLWISTHQGTANLFYRMTKNTESNLIRISSWWWENRRCRRGLYRIRNNSVELLNTGYTGTPIDTALDDSGFKFPVDYFENPLIFKLERWIRGRLRSFWSDKHFLRPGIDPSTVLEEYYGLSAVSDRQLIRQSVCDVARATSKRPMAIGDLHEGQWRDDPDGPIRVWLNPERPNGTYVLGADPGLSAMSGDYKAASAFDTKTGEQILAARWVQIDPVQFTIKVAEIGKWLSGARGYGSTPIAFESTGVGVAFRSQIMQMRYPSVCHPEGKPEKPGYPTSNQSDKEDRFLEFGRAIFAHDYIVRDEQTAVELAGFEFNEKDDLVYSFTDGHGDNATAAALSWQGGKKRRLSARKLYENRVKHELELSERESRPRCYSDQFYYN